MNVYGILKISVAESSTPNNSPCSKCLRPMWLKTNSAPVTGTVGSPTVSTARDFS
jgi:hypothetical protein